MTVRTRRVWRVSPGTLAAVWAFVAVAGIGVPVLAVLAWLRSGELLISAFLVLLAAAAVVYGWRFGLHPRLVASADGVQVVNPGRRTSIPWDELTVIAPGENGLVLGTELARTEAWCVQKSRSSFRQGRSTRADTIVAELEQLRDHFDPPLEDEQTGIRIRRARQSDLELLSSLERAASRADLPADDVRRRWRRLLRDRRVHVRVLEEYGNPAGLVAWDTRGQLRDLAVAPRHTRQGHGSLLLHYATEELMTTGVRELVTWVPEDNPEARGFCRSRGWRDTDERGENEDRPHTSQVKMVHINPRAPRRRAT